MDFEEMKKIWDTQNSEYMYAINEEALLRRVRTRSRRANRITDLNDIGLMLIAIATALILLLIGEQSLYDYISVVALLMITFYILAGRRRRQKLENRFDRTILGDLEQAIHSTRYEIRRAETFFWWYLLPLGIPTLVNMVQAGVPVWKWLIVPFAFVLSYLLVRWELRRKHLPRKRELEALRDLLKSK